MKPKDIPIILKKALSFLADKDV
ncbi:hypothetical protein PPBDW_I21146 [Photobacterium kishitanii]|nr:hypothetical protein PPBDW_I21146 [Photobacterium kishitanii]